VQSEAVKGEEGHSLNKIAASRDPYSSAGWCLSVADRTSVFCHVSLVLNCWLVEMNPKNSQCSLLFAVSSFIRTVLREGCHTLPLILLKFLVSE
jgi:hypothetical protein